jgi:hypothetical protein
MRTQKGRLYYSHAQIYTKILSFIQPSTLGQIKTSIHNFILSIRQFTFLFAPSSCDSKKKLGFSTEKYKQKLAFSLALH